MKKIEYKKRKKLHLQKLKKILKISWKNGWFCYKNRKVIQKVASKNYNERPQKTDLTLIVIHNISLPPNNFENKWVEKFFQKIHTAYINKCLTYVNKPAVVII